MAKNSRSMNSWGHIWKQTSISLIPTALGSANWTRTAIDYCDSISPRAWIWPRSRMNRCRWRYTDSIIAHEKCLGLEHLMRYSLKWKFFTPSNHKQLHFRLESAGEKLKGRLTILALILILSGCASNVDKCVEAIMKSNKASHPQVTEGERLDAEMQARVFCESQGKSGLR